jgi:uncharacterized membrane protein YfcA
MTAEAVIVIGLGVFIIAFMKGAFGGGFAVIGIPFLSLAMPPTLSPMSRPPTDR